MSTSVPIPSAENHSFNILYAKMYGIEEAILIHHFQHWIRVNRRLKRNFFEGRTWMYQTREEIAAHFPYFSPDKVRRVTDSLVKKGVLIKGNYNKRWQDKTLWYAFNDELIFVPEIPDESSAQNADLANSSNRLAKMPNRVANLPDRIGKNAKALPDTKHTNTKTTDIEKNDDGPKAKVEKKSEEKSSSFSSEKEILKKEIGKTLTEDQFEGGYRCYCEAKEKQDILNPAAWIITAGKKQFKTKKDESKKIREFSKKIEGFFNVHRKNEVSVYAMNNYLEIAFPGVQCPSKCINYEGRTFASWWLEVKGILGRYGLPEVAV